MDTNFRDEYDIEFLNLLAEIEKRVDRLSKQEQLRVKAWCKKLCQIVNNVEWKKNRNLHAISLFDCILNEKFREPYNKLPPDGPVQIISKTIVKSRLSQKFLKSSFVLNKSKEQLEAENNNFNSKFLANDLLYGNKKYDPDEKNKPIQSNEEKLLKNAKKLKGEGKEKDKLIEKLQKGNKKLEGRIMELEKMLSSFLQIEKQQK